MGVLCLFLFYCTLLCVLSSFAIILKRKRENWMLCFFIVLWMSCYCKYSVTLSHDVSWVCLRCVIVVFPDHTRSLFKRFDAY